MLFRSYHQILLEEKSRKVTTFTTHRGLYRYKRLPFGINSASEVFQSAIEDALRGISGVRNIANDRSSIISDTITRCSLLLESVVSSAIRVRNQKPQS